MRFILNVFLIAIVSFAGCLFLPWWWIAIAGFISILLLPMRAGRSFLSGFIAVFLLWLIHSLIISTGNDHILARKMSLLIISTESPALLILITAFIGGILAGLGALSASLLTGIRRK